MKKLRITVSGKVYDVEVQVLQDDEAIGSPANLPYPGAAALPSPDAARPAPSPRRSPAAPAIRTSSPRPSPGPSRRSS
jgi:hypothetical protein